MARGARRTLRPGVCWPAVDADRASVGHRLAPNVMTPMCLLTVGPRLRKGRRQCLTTISARQRWSWHMVATAATGWNARHCAVSLLHSIPGCRAAAEEPPIRGPLAVARERHPSNDTRAET
jgi:hypothetical protein